MPDQLLQDVFLLAPEVALTVTFLVAIIVDLVFRRTSLPVAAVVMTGLVVTGFLVVAQTGVEESVFSNMIAVDPFAFFFKLVVVLSAILVVIFSLWSGELQSNQARLGEYYSLLPALTLGMMLMAGASNLLMM